MTALVFFVVYAGLAAFLAATAIRAVMYARQPLHLRWELYPVPHEPAERVVHGGSYFEEPKWWEKPRTVNRLTELKFMLSEMLFLKALWEFNRGLWFRSFPFHAGLYLLIASVKLLILSALLTIFWPAAMAGAFGAVLGGLVAVFGALGAFLAMIGAFTLLLKRLRDPDLKNYTAPGDVFNLLFFLAAFGVLAAGYLLRGPDYPGTLALAVALFTFDTSVQIPGLMAAGLILTALLITYIPLTHMAHYVGKYFTYHSIRWDDLPAAQAKEIQQKIAQYLAYKPHWSAPHIRADGKKTWAEIATTNPHAGGQSK